MIITCEKCSTKYSIDDAKLASKSVLKMKCSKCGHLWVVELGKSSDVKVTEPVIAAETQKSDSKVDVKVVKEVKIPDKTAAKEIKEEPKEEIKEETPKASDDFIAKQAFDLEKYLDDLAGSFNDDHLITHQEVPELEDLSSENKIESAVIAMPAPEPEMTDLEIQNKLAKEKTENLLRKNQDITKQIVTPKKPAKSFSNIADFKYKHSNGIIPTTISAFLLLIIVVTVGVLAIKKQDYVLQKWPSVYNTYYDFSLLRKVDSREAFKLEPNVKVAYVEQNGQVAMTVDGSVTHVFFRELQSPQIKIYVKNESGNVLSEVSFYPVKVFLNPGETITFHQQIINPPIAARKVSVGF